MNEKIFPHWIAGNDGKCVVDEKFLIEKLKFVGYFENAQLLSPLFVVIKTKNMRQEIWNTFYFVCNECRYG